MWAGRCRDPLEGAVCGADRLGARLYVGTDGEGECGCMEGWTEKDGVCHQVSKEAATCSGRECIV